MTKSSIWIHFNLAICLLLVWNPLFAQEQEVIFHSLKEDLGEIREIEGPVEHLFLFTNNSEFSTSIVAIEPSCDCTQAGFTEGPIKPGDSGYIRVMFNPHNRPGTFKKYVDVKFSIPEFNQTLEINGLVYPGSMDRRKEFKIAAGGLRKKSDYLNFGFINDQKDAVMRVELFNTTGNDISILSDKNRGKAYVRFDEMVVPARSFVEFPLFFSTDSLGYFADRISIGSSEGKVLAWDVHATVHKYLTEEEQIDPPEIRFSRIEFDFGRKTKGQTLEAVFEIYNYGKSELEIFKLQPNCECLDIRLSSHKVKPGETQFLNVAFRPTIDDGWQAKHISLFTNDPTQPVRRLTVKTRIR